MADGFCKRLTDWWAAHPDFDNCRSVGSLKACVPSGYVVAWSRAVHVPERLRLQGRLPQRVIESFNGKFRDERLNQSVFCPCTMPAEPLKPAGRITTNGGSTAHWIG